MRVGPSLLSLVHRSSLCQEMGEVAPQGEEEGVGPCGGGIFLLVGLAQYNSVGGTILSVLSSKHCSEWQPLVWLEPRLGPGHWPGLDHTGGSRTLLPPIGPLHPYVY